MTDEPHFSDEFVDNFIENVFDLWFDEALADKRLDRDEFEKGQVLLKNPFALSQFDDLGSDDSEVEVRVNDDAQVKMKVRLKDEESLEAGEPVYAHQIAGFEEVILDEDEADYGHVTLVRSEVYGWIINFDFRRNQTYLEPLLDAADQFNALAEYARDNEMWRGFVETAFHAAERMMKIEVIFFGWTAETHSQVQARYHDIVNMGQGNPELYRVFNQLKGKYRFAASYVDPRGDIDEREFEFSDEKANEFLEIIKDHRENLNGNN